MTCFRPSDDSQKSNERIKTSGPASPIRISFFLFFPRPYPNTRMVVGIRLTSRTPISSLSLSRPQILVGPRPHFERRVSTAPPLRAALEDVVTIRDGRVEDQGASAGNEDRTYPAELDAKKFDLHWSVEFWRQFSAKEALKDVLDEGSPVSARLSAAQDTLRSALTASNALASTDSFRYVGYGWRRHRTASTRSPCRCRPRPRSHPRWRSLSC